MQSFMMKSNHLKPTSRNGEIDFFRFVFAVIVFSFHFGYAPAIFKSGYLCVEFFFVLSGYFLMQHIEKNKCDTNNATLTICNYAKNRLIRLYFSYLIVCILELLIRYLILSSISLRTVITKGFWEILLLQAFGFGFSTTILWYVSALIIASVFIYLLFLCLKDYFLPVIFFGAFILLAFLYQENQGLSSLNNHFIVSDGLLRGIAEMSLGCILFKVLKVLPNVLNRYKKILFIPKYFLLVLILYTMTKESGIKDFSCLLFILIFIALLFMDESPVHKIFNNKICYFLGDISYDFYLNQIIIIYFARVLPTDLLQEHPAITFMIFILVDLILSLATRKISKIAESIIHKNIHCKIKLFSI